MPAVSSALLQQLSNRYPAWGEVERFVAEVVSLSPLLVLLFGSLARRDFTQESDVDILVVFDRPMAWEVVYRFSTGVIQPLVKELNEVLWEIHEGNTFFIEALEDGIPLLDHEGTYERLRCQAEAAVAHLGLVREEGGWRGGGNQVRTE